MLLKDEEFLPQATAMIDMAHHHIDIATFKAELTSLPKGRRLRVFFDKLFAKHDKGIKIRFLINWHDIRRAVPMTNLVVMNELLKRGIEVRHLGFNRCCHAKIIIVDQRRAIIGSHNLSVKSCHSNFEISYLISDPVSVARLSCIFCHTYQNSQATRQRKGIL